MRVGSLFTTPLGSALAKLKLAGFSKLTKTLSANIYDVC
jgi:hypothetical protein